MDHTTSYIKDLDGPPPMPKVSVDLAAIERRIKRVQRARDLAYETINQCLRVLAPEIDWPDMKVGAIIQCLDQKEAELKAIVKEHE